MTRNKEDYLKIIYELGGKYKKVNNKDISKALGVSAPSVSEMIRKLIQDGYVESENYQGVILTQLGLKKGLEIRRRHLLWEVFLVEKLGYDWEDVHEEAEKLEHITSPKLEKALDKYLNHPKFCPHGSPIINGNSDEVFEYTSIFDLQQGDKATIIRLKDNKEVLSFINNVGLRIGDSIELVNKDLEKNLFTMKNYSRDMKIQLDIEYLKYIYVNKESN